MAKGKITITFSIDETHPAVLELQKTAKTLAMSTNQIAKFFFIQEASKGIPIDFLLPHTLQGVQYAPINSDAQIEENIVAYEKAEREIMDKMRKERLSKFYIIKIEEETNQSGLEALERAMRLNQKQSK